MSGSVFNRRDFFRISTGLMAAISLAGLPACLKKRAIRIAVQPWCGYQFMFLARDEAWLDSDKVQLIETKIASESVSALKEGTVDGAALTLDEVLRLRDEGMRLSVVAIFDISAGADVVLAKPEITKPSELKGKRIGIESTSLGAVILSNLLAAGGLQRNEVTVVPMDENHLYAWEHENLDAIQAYAPTLAKLENMGLRSIFDSRQMPQTILDVLAVRTEAASEYSEGLRSLIAGHFHALQQWHSNPIDNAYHLAVRLGVKPDEVRGVYKGLDLPDALYNREYLVHPASLLNQSSTEIARIMHKEGMLKQQPVLEHLFVADYLPREGA